MKNNDFMKKIVDAKDAIVEFGTDAEEKVAEKCKRIKDSDAVEKISQEFRDGVEEVKSTIEELAGQPYIVDGHTVLRFKGTQIKLLIPDEFKQITKKKAVSAIQESFALKQKMEAVYCLQTPNSFNIVSFFYPEKGHAMKFGDTKSLVDGIHQSLADNQGLIEAKGGKTKRGYDYIYSIVKSVGNGKDVPVGVIYFLRMDIGFDDKIVEIYGNFEEQGTTGMRESMVGCLANGVGLYKIGGDGWSEDPYDANFDRGICKNLAEKEGLDGMFPGHPLSLAHAFLSAVINDELIIYNEENDDEKKEEKNTSNESQTKASASLIDLFVDECKRPTFLVEVEPGFDEETEEKRNSRESLNETLKNAIDEYNIAYSSMNNSGTNLYVQRERSIDLIRNVEKLINSIANHPKDFETTVSEISVMREEFKQACEIAKQELDAAKKSGVDAGAGIASGAAIASLAPTAAMWVATTFGTASTGTAISALSGAAAESAALAWLGGGTLAAGGGGVAAGEAILALAGPIGWGIAGATLLTSVVLFANKKIKFDKQRKEEIEAVLKNTECVKEVDGRIRMLLEKTGSLREAINEQYGKCLSYFGKDFGSISAENQLQLGTLVNETKSLAALLSEQV